MSREERKLDREGGISREDRRNIAGGVFCCRNDPHWTLMRAEEALFRFLGYTEEELKECFDNRLTAVIAPETIESLREAARRQLEYGSIICNGTRLNCKNGNVRWAWMTAELTRDEEGEYFRCVFYDISDEMLKLKKLALNESRYDIIFQQTQDTIFEWSQESGQLYFSPNFERKFGYRAPESGFPDSLIEAEIVYPEDCRRFVQYMAELKGEKDREDFECRFRSRDGSYLWVRIHASAIRDASGRTKRILGLISDIQEQKQSILDAEKQASRDPLTDLYNHRTTELLIKRYLASGQGEAALLVMDVDNFKNVNDTLGHSYGDAVLNEIAFQLKKLFRASDVVGRVGGDEFVVFMENVSQLSQVEKKAGAIVEMFHDILAAQNIQYRVSGSVGIALFPRDGERYEELFEKADLAMYNSKHSGRDRYAFFKETMLTEQSRQLRKKTDELDPHNFREHTAEYTGAAEYLPETSRLELMRTREQWIRAVLGQINACVFGVDLDTYEVLFSNEGTRGHLTVQTGDICYRSINGREKPCPDCPLAELGHGKNYVIKELYHSDSGKWSEVAASRILKDGREIGLISSHDITRYRADAAMFRFLHQNMPGGMVGGYLEKGYPLYFVNSRMIEYLGYDSREEFMEAISGCLTNGIYPEDRGWVHDEVNRQLAQRGEYEVQYRMLRRDGSYLWVKDIGKQMTAENGRPAVTSMCLDITEQVSLQNQLELYRKAALGGAFVIRVDEDLTLLYGNDIFYNLHEYTKKELAERLHEKCARYIYPPDLPKVRRVIADTIKSGAAWAQCELRVMTGKGNIRWILATGALEYRGGEKVINGFVTDITELQKLREKIARSEEVYRIALRQTGINVWEYNLAERVILMTESAEILHGFKDRVEDVPESLIEDGHIHPSSCADFRALYQKLYEGAERAQADILTRTPDGTGWWWERITYTTIYDENGAPARAIAVGEDVTRQKEAEARYRQELQMRYAFSEELLVSSCVNLTINQVEFCQASDRTEAGQYEGLTYDSLFEAEYERVVNTNDQKRYRKLFSREALLEAYRQYRTTISLEYRRKERNGRIKWVNASFRLVENTMTRELYAYGSVRDIGGQKKIELGLQNRAEKDAATNTYNRETALQMMKTALSIARREGQGVILLIFSVDNYSLLIEKNSCEAAEGSIQELSDLIRLKLGKNQIAGRFYGDEVVVFLSGGPDPDLVSELAEEIRRSVEQSNRIPGLEISAKLSIGMVIGGEEEVSELYQQAHLAMETARTKGDGRCVIYDRRMGRGEKPAGREEKKMLAVPACFPNVIQNGGYDVKEILLRCAFALTSSAELKKAVNPVLCDLADFYSADRVYLLLPDIEEGMMFYEWKKEGLLSKKELIPKFFRPETLSKLELDDLRKNVALDAAVHTEEACPKEWGYLKKEGLNALYAAALTGEGGEVVGFLGMDNPRQLMERQNLVQAVQKFLTNELDKRQLQRKQEYLSYHDGMTGLLNRNSFAQYSGALQEESLISLGVASLDINGLKRINTRYGSRYGDDLVRRIAACLRQAFTGGHVFRFAGDEFLAVCENLTQEAFVDQIMALRESVNKSADSLLSVGYVWSDSDINLDSMMLHADERLMVAKQEYYRDLEILTKGHDPALQRSVQEGLRQGRYRMFLQPKADLRTGRIAGAEALVRYFESDGSLVSPERFVPLLEKEGLIRYIDLFIFEEVCKTLNEWKREGVPLIPISLNFSRSTLLEERLTDAMEEIRGRYGVEQRYLEIEITESFGEMERGTLSGIARQIKAIGYRLSLDDFGAKYSNIAVLSSMDMDVLKLDKTLVNDLTSSDAMRIIVRNFLCTCKELSITSIAEGVETLDQLQTLRELQCDYIQGYYLNKPIPRDDFERLYLESPAILFQPANL